MRGITGYKPGKGRTITAMTPVNRLGVVPSIAQLVPTTTADHLFPQAERPLVQKTRAEFDAVGKSSSSLQHGLVTKNQDGKLTATEKHELNTYRRVGFMLGLTHSKARRSLKSHAVAKSEGAHCLAVVAPSDALLLDEKNEVSPDIVRPQELGRLAVVLGERGDAVNVGLDRVR
jgi:hypothetical protein